MTERCQGCGASTNRWTCEELFHTLLALDHQRVQPWGALHGVSVACYLLQHPPTDDLQHRDARLTLVSVFCEAGLDGVQRLTDSARRRNSHRARTAKVEPALGSTGPVAERCAAFDVTIHDVAADGTFPVDGATERVETWANAVRAAWTPAGSG